MKQSLLLCTTLLLVLGSFGQTTTLLPDQNPNYLISMDKYTKFRDSLLLHSNTTVQQTYQAYDWYEAREARRTARRNARWQRNGWNNWGWNNRINWGYYNNGWSINNGWNNWGWNGGWNNGWGNNWGWRPQIGFRTGNWYFGF